MTKCLEALSLKVTGIHKTWFVPQAEAKNKNLKTIIFFYSIQFLILSKTSCPPPPTPQNATQTWWSIEIHKHRLIHVYDIKLKGNKVTNTHWRTTGHSNAVLIATWYLNHTVNCQRLDKSGDRWKQHRLHAYCVNMVTALKSDSVLVGTDTTYSKQFNTQQSLYLTNKEASLSVGLCVCVNVVMIWHLTCTVIYWDETWYEDFWGHEVTMRQSHMIL